MRREARRWLPLIAFMGALLIGAWFIVERNNAAMTGPGGPIPSGFAH